MAACSSATESLPTETTFEIIHLQISPTLQHWLADIATCAGDIPDFGITTEVMPDTAMNLNQADLILRIGDREETDPHVAVLGTEEIVIFTSEEINLDAISLESLQAIYDGSITNWRELPAFSGQDSETNLPITAFSYPEGNTLRELFISSFLSGKPIASRVEAFSTIDYLNRYLETNPYSIGYVLESQIPENARRIEITGFDHAAAEQYVLAITQEEPQGSLLQMLLCIQE